MCYKFLECIIVWDIFSLIVGIVLSPFTTIFIIKFFRPRIRIGNPTRNGNILKISVKNKSKCFAVANLRIEAAAVFNDQTYHLDFDRYDFMMLSRKTDGEAETPFERTFHAYDVNQYTKNISLNCRNMNDFFDLLNNNQSYLRVRIHAYHEFTGFGKAFEAKFRLNQGVFEPKNNNNSIIN